MQIEFLCFFLPLCTFYFFGGLGLGVAFIWIIANTLYHTCACQVTRLPCEHHFVSSWRWLKTCFFIRGEFYSFYSFKQFPLWPFVFISHALSVYVRLGFFFWFRFGQFLTFCLHVCVVEFTAFFDSNFFLWFCFFLWLAHLLQFLSWANRLFEG